jgi:hypothetical protein
MLIGSLPFSLFQLRRRNTQARNSIYLLEPLDQRQRLEQVGLLLLLALLLLAAIGIGVCWCLLLAIAHLQMHELVQQQTGLPLQPTDRALSPTQALI